MFLKNSRYAGLPTQAVATPAGEVRVVKLRPLPATTGEPYAVRAHDQLDALSEQRYGGDATRHWHIADANAELEAAELVRQSGREILVPKA